MRPTAALALALAALTLACGYGPTVGPPPGPVPHPSNDQGTPQPAGELAPVTGHGAQRVLAAGIYRGDLTIDGNGNVVQGAGLDRTIIQGDLRIHGDANVVHSLHVLGNCTAEGEENDLRGAACGEPPPPAPRPPTTEPAAPTPEEPTPEPVDTVPPPAPES